MLHRTRMAAFALWTLVIVVAGVGLGASEGLADITIRFDLADAAHQVKGGLHVPHFHINDRGKLIGKYLMDGTPWGKSPPLSRNQVKSLLKSERNLEQIVKALAHENVRGTVTIFDDLLRAANIAADDIGRKLNVQAATRAIRNALGHKVIGTVAERFLAVAGCAVVGGVLEVLLNPTVCQAAEGPAYEYPAVVIRGLESAAMAQAVARCQRRAIWAQSGKSYAEKMEKSLAIERGAMATANEFFKRELAELNVSLGHFGPRCAVDLGPGRRPGFWEQICPTIDAVSDRSGYVQSSAYAQYLDSLCVECKGWLEGFEEESAELWEALNAAQDAEP